MSNPTDHTKKRNRRQKHKISLSGGGPSVSSSPNASTKSVDDSNTAIIIKSFSECLGVNSDVNCEHKIQKQPLHLSMQELNMITTKNNVAYPKPNVSRRAAGSNWKILNRGNALETSENVADPQERNEENAAPQQSKSARLRQKRKNAARNKYVAMDCEMVGVGNNGQDDMLARVSIVNKDGKVLLDKFVKPCEAVTDYRTSVSGIRPHNIENGENFAKVQDEVVKLLQGKILIGHAIRNDLAVLHITHPFSNIRDTSRYKPLCRLVSNGRTPSLKKLAKVILGIEIQDGEHSSVEDARAAMSVYNNLSTEWEKYHQRHHDK